jgi:short-subunit dehydrogenase involved in D-alanine esterification of teichoic acids
MSNITDKVVVITGASGGIGKTTATFLAAQGARVVLGARRLDRIDAVVQEITASGGKAIGFGTDVTKRAEVEALIRKAVDTFGRVDVLVNNAGIMPIAPIEALKVDEWDSKLTSISKDFYMELPLPCLTCRNRRAATSSTWLRFSGSKCSPPVGRSTVPPRPLCVL